MNRNEDTKSWWVRNDMSTIAIVMATYNGEKYVGEQIESILLIPLRSSIFDPFHI
jgi:hypothetical protein